MNAPVPPNWRNPEIDALVARSTRWSDELTALRTVLAGCGLLEERKWGKACYSHEGANIVIAQEMKEFLALMFFKGALLADPAGVLEEQGPNSRSARRICLRSVHDVQALAPTITAYVTEAVAVERAGLSVEATPPEEPPEELRVRLDTDPALRAAFEALTPGRQREYTLFFGGAKQSATRSARIDKHVARILAGKGLRDR